MSDDLQEFYDKVKKGGGMRVAKSSNSIESDCAPESYDEEDGFKNLLAGSGERRWAAQDDKFYGCNATYNNLPAGLYSVAHSHQIGPYLARQIIDVDELITLPDSTSEEIIHEIQSFWNLKPEFEKRGFVHKRGILIWGDPGCGKTSTINLLLRDIINREGIAIFARQGDLTSLCLQMVRRIEPERPMIVVLEDFEDMCQRWGESEYLSMLDGETQVGNVVFIATTNYPEMLDKRFIDRPSRFDSIKKMEMPNAEARRLFLETKESDWEDGEIDIWVKKTDGFSIAHLKEAVISVKCYQRSLEETIKRLKKMQKRNAASDDNPNKEFGFGS